MTIGDMIEKVGGAFGSEPRKVRNLRKRISVVADKIKSMEDGLKTIRRQVTALEGRVDDLKHELQVEMSAHNQDLIMDDIERLDKEFSRLRDLAKLKGLNVNAAQTLHSKLEQLLENAVNGGSTMELEDILGKVEDMDEDLSDVRKLVEELDRPTSLAVNKERDITATDREDSERAARMARILGKSVPVAKSTDVGAFVSVDATPISTPTATPITDEAKPGVAVAN